MKREERTYSLTELAHEAGVTIRTVRYYITQGLLPPAESAGPATRYGEGHLARLRVIKRMQAAHLPLAEIRAQLESISDEELIRLAAADASQPSGAAPVAEDSALDYVHWLMDSGGAPSAGRGKLGLWSPHATRESRPRSPPSDPSRMQSHQRSTWERVSLAPDVELHLRRPLDRATNKRVEVLLRAAKEIFDGER